MDMANGNSKILTVEQEKKLRQPIEDYVGKIQKQIDSLRVDGTDTVSYTHLDVYKRQVREEVGSSRTITLEL